MLEAHLLTPGSGSAFGDVEPLPPPPCSGVARAGAGALLRADSGMVAPAGFKAAKRRKTPRFIREESRRLRTPLKPTRRPSSIDPELLEDPDVDKLIAGVARLIFRLIVEGQQGCYQTGSFGSVGVDPSAEFNEEVFFVQPRENWPRLQRCCNCFRRREKAALPEAIFRLLRDCLEAGHFSNGLVVVCAVYVERFVQLSRRRVTEENWQQVLLAALLLASKVFEDIHPWNIDYAAILWKAAGLRFRDRLSIYHLESKFLQCLCWSASVSGEVFANYYFALKNADTPPSPTHRHHDFGDSLRRCSSWCGPSCLADIPESSEETQWKSSGQSLSQTGSSSPLSTGSRSSRSPGQNHTPRHTPRQNQAQTPQDRSPVREGDGQDQSECRKSDPRWKQLVASFPPNSGPDVKKALSMEDMLWTDRANPLIGTFRHAPHAEPPSRHINPRLPPAKSAPQLSSALWPVEGGGPGNDPGGAAPRRQPMSRVPSANAIAEWARSISA